jgi:hypothetical protein
MPGSSPAALKNPVESALFLMSESRNERDGQAHYPEVREQRSGTMPIPTEIVARRLRDADEFLRAGREEILHGKQNDDDLLVRQGFEKLFHALLNAYVARVYVYRGFDFYPESHSQLLDGLGFAGLEREAGFYLQMMEICHKALYYRGETNLFELAERYVASIGQEIVASRDWVAEVS